MSIKYGNSDFNLLATQTGPNRMKVSWSRENTAAGVTLTVYRPGDSKVVYTKTYTGGEKRGEVAVTVDYPGEHKVHISTARGVVYDYMFCVMKLYQKITETKTITQTDINKQKAGEAIALVIGAGAVGFTFKTLKILSTPVAGKVNQYITKFLVYTGLAGILLGDSSTTFPNMKIGDKIVTITSDTVTGYETVVTYYQAAANGGGTYQKKFSYNYLKF